jgi:dihydroorotase
MECPSGMPSIQHTLLVMLELVNQGELDLEDIPTYTSHNVSSRFQIRERGFIRENYWADLVLVDLDSEQNISKENISYFCGWSPFEGDTFHSKVISTFVNGKLVYNEGRILESNQGMQLEFSR